MLAGARREQVASSPSAPQLQRLIEGTPAAAGGAGTAQAAAGLGAGLARQRQHHWAPEPCRWLPSTLPSPRAKASSNQAPWWCPAPIPPLTFTAGALGSTGLGLSHWDRHRSLWACAQQNTGMCLYVKVLETGTSTALLNRLINMQ